MMTERQAAILALLRTGDQTDSSIAHALDCPAPSVRRGIQELIRLGEPISFAGNGIYRIVR